MPDNKPAWFDDETAYPDETEISLGEQKFKLADVRGALRSTRQERDSVAQQRDLAAQQRQEAIAQGQALQETLRALQSNAGRPADSQDGRRQDGQGSEDEMFADPYSSRLLGRIEQTFKRLLEQERSAQQSWVKPLLDTGQLLMRNQLELDARHQFSRYNDWPKDWDHVKAFQEAVGRRMVNGSGFPDLHKLHDEVTAPLRLERAVAEALERGKAEGRQAAEADLQQRQRSRFSVVTSPKAGTPVKGAESGKGQKARPATLSDYLNSEEGQPTEQEIQNQLMRLGR